MSDVCCLLKFIKILLIYNDLFTFLCLLRIYVKYSCCNLSNSYKIYCDYYPIMCSHYIYQSIIMISHNTILIIDIRLKTISHNVCIYIRMHTHGAIRLRISQNTSYNYYNHSIRLKQALNEHQSNKQVI